MDYNLDFFISKFEAIPEELWCTGAYTKGNKHCAYGHCDPNTKQSTEGLALGRFFNRLLNSSYDTVVTINDGDESAYQQPTPKQRILAALYDIKANQAVEEAKKVIEYKTLSATFLIPVNAAGEESVEIIDEENYEEQERFNRWYEQKIELEQVKRF